MARMRRPSHADFRQKNHYYSYAINIVREMLIVLEK